MRFVKEKRDTIFQSSSITTPIFKSFVRKTRNEFRKSFGDIADNIQIKCGHFYFSGYLMGIHSETRRNLRGVSASELASYFYVYSSTDKFLSLVEEYGKLMDDLQQVDFAMELRNIAEKIDGGNNNE